MPRASARVAESRRGHLSDRYRGLSRAGGHRRCDQSEQLGHGDGPSGAREPVVSGENVRAVRRQHQSPCGVRDVEQIALPGPFLHTVNGFPSSAQAAIAVTTPLPSEPGAAP